MATAASDLSFYLERETALEAQLRESGLPFGDPLEALQRASEGLSDPIASTFVAWSEANRYISKDESGHDGMLSLDLTPYLREPMECLADDEHEYVIMQKPAQIGWTSIVSASKAAYTMAVDPCQMLFLFPTDDLAARWAKMKFQPMCKSNPWLFDLLKWYGNRDKNIGESSNLLQKKFPGGYLLLIGSNSAAKLSDIPVKVLMIEEPDRCAKDVQGEGPAIDLAIERTKSHDDRKIAISGSPTRKGTSAIERYMQATDQRHYHVPCRKSSCAHDGPLSWDMVIWDKRPGRGHYLYGDNVPESARFRCNTCKTEFDNDDKNKQVQNGRWVATTEDTGAAGFYLNEFVAPFGPSRVSNLVAKYLSARAEEIKGKKGPMIAFTNLTLGLTYEEKVGDQLDRSMLEARRHDYKGAVPNEVKAAGVSVDVQGDRLELEIIGFAPEERTYGLAYMVIDGCIDKESAMRELDAVMQAELTRHDGTTFKPLAMAIDSGNFTTKVYNFVQTRQRKYKVIAVKGDSGHGREYAVNHGKTKKRRVNLWYIGVDQVKDDMFNAFAIEKEDAPGYCSISKEYPSNWESMMRAERRIKKIRRGMEITTYEQIADRRNEAIDCRVYGLALRYAFKAAFDEALGVTAKPELEKPKPKEKPGEILPRQRFIRKPEGRWLNTRRRL